MADILVETMNTGELISGDGINIDNIDGNYSISSNSEGILIDNVGDILAGDTIQNALNSLNTKISDIDNIQSGIIIRTTSEGKDVDYPNVEGLLENTMYLRLVSKSGKVIHISAYEIDRALDTVARLNMDKADQSDLDELSAELDSKASAVRLELFENDIKTKADKSVVDNLTEIVNSKADFEDVIELSTLVDKKVNADTVNELTNTVNTKASIDTVVKMQNDVQALHNALNSLSDNATIIAIQNQINYLNNEIQKFLTSDDLDSLLNDNTELVNQVEANTNKITTLETSMANKASVSYVQKNLNELNTVITNVAAKVKNKAEKSDLANKASQDDLSAVVKKLNSLDSYTTKSIEDINANYTKLQDNLSKKASKSSIEILTNELNIAIDKKVDKTFFKSAINGLNKKVDEIDIETPIENVEKEIHDVQTALNNKLSGVQSSVNVHERKISQHDTKITELQANNVKLERSVSNEWVRVMTPEDYNKMSKNPNYSDGTKNPNAIQPNTVYMLVRYNKPIAIYIGTILIAEAKNEGPAGFVYDFPIIFG